MSVLLEVNNFFMTISAFYSRALVSDMMSKKEEKSVIDES